MRFWACSIGLWTSLAGQAHAAPSLKDDADKVAHDAEALEKLDVVLRSTSFLEAGHLFEVPPTPDARCRNVVILASRKVALSAVSGGKHEDPDELLAIFADKDSPRRKASEAGLLVLSGCDDAADALARVFVRMDSARGSVELLVATGLYPLKELDGALGRRLGPSAPRGDPGPPLPATSLSSRREMAEQRARADGATNVLLLEAKAGPSGAGELSIKVPVGCHRFDVMGEATEGQPGMDLDAELRDADTAARLARDRGETPDARVEACVGRTTELSLVFAGAAPGGRVVVHDALFPLAEGIPSHWGPRAQAGLMAALKRRMRRGPERSPVFEALGAQGSTKATMPVEPGRCYVAAVTLLRGASRGMRLVASASARVAFEEVPPTEEGASVVFCASGKRSADLSIDVPGASVGWLLSVWLLGASTPTKETVVDEGAQR